MARSRARGFQLVELMIALSLGLVLVVAFLGALRNCRTLFATLESVARLQDASRYVLAVLVPDLEHAGFYGFSARRDASFMRGGAEIAAGTALREPTATAVVAPVPGLPSRAHDCGTNFAVNLERIVAATNDAYRAGVDARDCAPTASADGARTGSDTLVVRHAALVTSAPHAGRIQVYSQRLLSQSPLSLFADGRAPGPVNPDREVRDLDVRLYYVANSSVDRRGWPALRVKALTESAGAAQFRDEEVLPGVEDLQVELGIASGEGSATNVRFVAGDDPTVDIARIVAVRVWLRIRADSTEPGFRDDRALDYAGVHFVPTPAEAAHRRTLVERTIAIRSAILSESRA